MFEIRQPDGTAEHFPVSVRRKIGLVRLVILPNALVDASRQLREQCARRLGLDFSSFLVIGRGGVSLAPDEAQPSWNIVSRDERRRAPAR